MLIGRELFNATRLESLRTTMTVLQTRINTRDAAFDANREAHAAPRSMTCAKK